MTTFRSSMRYLCGNCETDLKDVVAREMTKASAHARRNAPPECPECGVVADFSIPGQSLRTPGAQRAIKVALRTGLPSVMRTQ